MSKQDDHLNPSAEREPWDTDFYETGSTRPPKSHRGLFALVLVGGIILGSVLTALGGINAKIIKQWQQTKQEDTLPVSLHAGGSTDMTDDPVQEDPNIRATVPGGTAVELHPSPESVDTLSQEGGMALQDIYKKSIPSTVSILCTLSGGSGSGSGVVLSADGYVITNYHVVEDAIAVEVLFTDGRVLTAQMVGGDKLSDLAVLYVQAEDLVPAEFGDSDALRVGDTVVAIGDPMGVELRGTMTDGIVSAINRNITTEGRNLNLIQTNAALNSGNSGGPLINCYGQVIGINTMKIGNYVNSTTVEGLGFAIPSTMVKEIVDQLLTQGYVSGRPELGITGTDVPEIYQYYHRLPSGVYVKEVKTGSDAEAKGIQVQDIIIALDGQRISSVDDIETILYSHQVGDTVEVVVYRAGDQYRMTVTLGESRP